MRTKSFLGLNTKGFHKVVYHEWGSEDNERVLVCVHGLARNSRDFDDIAKVLSREYRVVCPDIVGRGESDWLPDPLGYAIPQYLSDMTALIARLGVEKVDWLGTSMGGIIGMALASLPNTPIRKLVLNDIGAFVAKESLQRIGTYLVPAAYDSLESAIEGMKQTYPALKHITDVQWQHLAKAGYRLENGLWTQHYDPAIGDITRAASSMDVDLWPIWRAISCPQMLIWGETSDVLSAATVQQMQAENSDLTLYSIPGTPHVPSLMEDEQIKRVSEWLRTH